MHWPIQPVEIQRRFGAQTRPHDSGDEAQADNRTLELQARACATVVPRTRAPSQEGLEVYRRAWITPGGPNAPHKLALAY